MKFRLLEKMHIHITELNNLCFAPLACCISIYFCAYFCVLMQSLKIVLDFKMSNFSFMKIIIFFQKIKIIYKHIVIHNQRSIILLILTTSCIEFKSVHRLWPLLYDAFIIAFIYIYSMQKIH